MCLDTHAFRLTKSTREAFGCVPDRQRGLCNISASRADVEDASIWHASFSKVAADPLTPSVAPLVEFYDDQDDEEMYDSEEIDSELDESLLAEPDVVESEPFASPNQDDDTEASPGTEHLMIEEPSALGSLNDEVATQAATSSPRPPFTAFLKQNEVSITAPVKVPEFRGPRCAVIHTSEVDIRFLPRPMEDPSVLFQHPLLQRLPPHLQWLDRFGRLNMLAQIPELGIVAVATQTGRVALLTLTRMECTKDLAFRLDAIVPFHSQEIAKHRPDMPLLGIAIGPIQGRELMRGDGESGSSHGRCQDESWRGVESSRRYRLMLTYYDHTVLSYELERPSKATNSTQDPLLAL